MKRNTQRQVVSIAVEHVEPRRLLATLVGTDLRIEGTAGNDRVRVETIGVNVVVTQNNVAQSFAKTKVKTINANLRNGNDRIDILWNVVATTTISGEGGNDTVIGGDYKDVIYTGSGNDFVYGGRGGDFIQTSAGNDFISPGSQNDTVDAGDGIDHVSYEDRQTAISGLLTAKIMQGSQIDSGVLTSTGLVEASNESDSLLNLESLSGSQAADSLTFNATMDPDYEGSLQDARFALNGGAGDDTLGVTSYFDSYPHWIVRQLVDGGAGNDLIFFDSPSRTTTLAGGAGNDTFSMYSEDSGVPAIEAGTGSDTLIALRLNVYAIPLGLEGVVVRPDHFGNVSITGNDEANDIYVSILYSNVVSVDARGGNDRITLGSPFETISRPTLIGGSGNDTIIGSIGADSILGGDGNDLLQPGLGNDTVDAGNGQDEVSYSDRSASIDIDFWHVMAYSSTGPGYANRSRATVTAGSEKDDIQNLETATLSRGNDTAELIGDLTVAFQPDLDAQIYRINTGEGDDSGFVTTGSSFSGSSGSVHQMVIDGGNGNDGFSAWPGYSTTIIGGAGNDVVNSTYDDGTMPFFLPGAGVDSVQLMKRSSVGYTMPADLENLEIWSEVGGVGVTGNDLNNTIIVRGGVDIEIFGRGGNDVIDARTANSFYEVASRLLDGGDGNDTIFGSPLKDVIKGGAGNDSIDGGLGADSIYGGTGTDRAKRDSADAIVDSIEVFV